MLERISWSAYWTVIGIGLAIYYLGLIILFYKKGLFLKNNLRSAAANKEQATANVQPNLFGFTDPASEHSSIQKKEQLPVDDQILMPTVHELIQELKAFIVDISERSFIKEEVIMGIQVIIKNYKRLEGSLYQKSINDFIKNECEDYCGIHLSEEETKRIWIG
jgi:hypothetical protein